MSGSAPAVDADGSLYLTTGNGAFDGTNNYGDSFLRLATPGLTVSDYFTPFDQQIFDSQDLDVAASGIVVLPDSAGTAQHPHIMIGGAKNGTIYVLDRDDLGHFNSVADTQIIQELPNLVGGQTWNGSSYIENCYSTAAYWQGNISRRHRRCCLRLFTFSKGQLSTSAASQTAINYAFPGVSPVISASGSSNGILWAIENSGTEGADRTGTAVLHAYDATNLASELYNSAQVLSDTAGRYAKFSIPTVVNGKVYVGTSSSAAVYGLLSSVPQTPAPSFGPTGGSYATAQLVTLGDSLPPSSTIIYYTTDGSMPTTSSSVYSKPITISANTVLRAVAVSSGYRVSSVSTATYIIGGLGYLFIQGGYATPRAPLPRSLPIFQRTGCRRS